MYLMLYSYIFVQFLYLSVMTSTLTCSGVLKILQFVVHVDWIFRSCSLGSTLSILETAAVYDQGLISGPQTSSPHVSPNEK